LLQQNSHSHDRISHSITTRFLGEMPDYLGAITKIVKESQHEIDICCSSITHGILSDHIAWTDFRFAIADRLNHGIKVRIIAGNEEVRRLIHRSQFEQAYNDWGEWLRQSSPLVSRTRQFINHYSTITALECHTPETFKKDVLALSRQAIHEWFKIAEITEIDNYVPVYYWIVDGTQAVFAIGSIASRSTIQGFLTSDLGLITSLQRIKDSYSQR